MPYTRRTLTSALLTSALVLGLCAGAAQAETYRVHFVGESLTLTPTPAVAGGHVTVAFRVRNDGPRIDRVQIRVMQPANATGEGRVLVDLANQTLNPGENTFSVSGNLQEPTAAQPFLLVKLLDRRTSTLPAPTITHSGSRRLVPAGYKLETFVPLM
jgi:hypothetical protein